MKTINDLYQWANAHQALAYALLTALGVFVNSLVVAFKDYPKVETVLGKVSDVLSFLTHADSPGTLKVLGAKSLPPGTPTTPALAAVGRQTPPPVAALALCFLGLALAPVNAHAQSFSAGPTVPLMEVRPGYAHPVSLAPGAGYQLSVTLPSLQRAIMGKAWDLLDLQLMVFGSSVSSSSGASFGALSGAAALCTLSSLLCLGGGHDIVNAGGAGWFGLFSISFNFALSPSAPPTGIEHGPAGMVRGNTLFFGSN